MKKLTCACFVFLAAVTGLQAQGTSAFTYQGRLETNGVGLHGAYELVFWLYDAPTAGTLRRGPITNSPVAVRNALFTTTVDFGGPNFDGTALYLQIAVRALTGGTQTILEPRQPLTPVPYATYASKAGNIQPGANPLFSGTATFNPASGPPFSVGNSTKVPNLNADLLDGLDSTAFVLKAGDTMSGGLNLANPATLSFGSTVRQMLNLWSTDYGIGVQAASLYFRTDGGFAWFREGVHADGTFDPGGGTALMTLDAGGQLRVNASGVTALTGISGFSGGNGVIGEANNGTSAFGVWGRSTDGFAGVFSSPNGYAGQFNGAVRVNFASPFNKPQLEIADPANAGFARLRMKTGTQNTWDIAVGSTPGLLQTNSLRFYSDGNGNVMSLSTNGTLFVRVLTITGGADLAEPFEMPAGIPKGAVVVIDERNPGKLKLSEQPYDSRVAGAVSGANGVNPGLTLQQHDKLEGGQHVALSGRVYVQADASNFPIKPGDLLTTSSTPGHAMRVSDHARAQGAILGKAMTGLDTGKGLVLVLVTLQ